MEGQRDYSEDLTSVPLKHGISLKEAEVAKALLDWDVLIDIPIAKHHDGVLFTGAMKNMMGSLASSTTHFFHFSTGASGYYDDIEFLSPGQAASRICRSGAGCNGCSWRKPARRKK